MIQTIQQQIALVQQFIKTIEPTCTNLLVLEQMYVRLAELQELDK